MIAQPFRLHCFELEYKGSGDYYMYANSKELELTPAQILAEITPRVYKHDRMLEVAFAFAITNTFRMDSMGRNAADP